MTAAATRATTPAARRTVRAAALASTLLVVAGGCGDQESSTSTIAATQPVATVEPDPTIGPTDTPGATLAPTPVVEEIGFTSGDFELVGDLTLPGSGGPHPAVVIVHGDGPQTRSSTPGTDGVHERFGAAGFAVFVWDKPGSGASTGTFDPERTLRQRAQILADGIAELAQHPAIDPDRIGLWGLSQAGWVMPMALERTDAVAFMVVVSGGGEDSIEQLGYQLGQRVVCEGGTTEQAAAVAEHFPRTAKGDTYETYLAAMDVLTEIDGWETFAGPAVKTEDEWQPWPPGIDAYFDPMTVIEHTTIPVLAVFGELDRYVDPIQGASAYEEALRAAGNPAYRVELLPGVGHTMQVKQTTCERGGATSFEYLALLDQWITTLVLD